MAAIKATYEELRKRKGIVYDEEYFLKMSKKYAEKSIANFVEELKEIWDID